MKNLIAFSLSITVALVFFFTKCGYSQNNYKESFNVADDVIVSVNTSYTNIILETWNKNKVEVEAFIEGDQLSEKEKQEIMKNWNLDIMGNSKKVSITSNAEGNYNFDFDFVGPIVDDMVMPMIANIKVPPLPENLLENIGDIHFDYEAFQKDEEGYMKKFEAQMDKKFGKDFEKKMENWGNEFAATWNEKKADSISEVYGKKMEKWGEAYGKRMEAWAEEIELKYGEGGDHDGKKVITVPHGKTIFIYGDEADKFPEGKGAKTIIIRIPKNTKTDINVRHGDLKMADAVNIKATLNYSSFTANSIDGGNTLISASYAPVLVNHWKAGTLNVKFVENCNLKNTDIINLLANSSDVRIGNVTKEAILSGSFGELHINKVADTFETIDISLENTDASVKIPEAPFSFYFNGNKSTLKYPKHLQLKTSKSADRVLVKGFNQTSSSNKTVTINSTYSNILLQ